MILDICMVSGSNLRNDQNLRVPYPFCQLSFDSL